MKASVAQQQVHVDHHPEEDDFWTANGNNKKGLIFVPQPSLLWFLATLFICDVSYASDSAR